MKNWKIILAVILCLLIVPVAAGVIYVNFVLEKVTVDDEEFDRDFDLMTNENLKEKNINVENIALFGVDCRTADYKGCRSDVMMVLSYDQKNNNVTVTSLVRDTYVEIGDRGFDKLNHAYAFGGPELAIQTINRTFDLDIEEYVTVDFWAVEKIINAIGGVEINVSSTELDHLNAYIDDLNHNSPDNIRVEHLEAPGTQKLTGREAVAYMRIRYVGDGDFERMKRQREVISSALEGVKTMSLPTLLSLSNELLETVKTNLSKGEIISLITTVVTKGIPSMNQFQAPSRDGGVGKLINGVYYFIPNTLLENVKNYHKLIYPSVEYKPTQTVIDLSQSLESYLN